MRTILDPRLLMHTQCAESSVATDQEFVDRLADWFESARDYTLGPAGASFLVERFAEFGYPDNVIEYNTQYSRGLISGNITRLLTQAFNVLGGPDLESEAVATSPEYTAQNALRAAMLGDLGYMIRNSLDVLATSDDHWDGSPAEISLGNFGAVHGITTPEDWAPSEWRIFGSRFFADRKLTIVGGSRDENFVARLYEHGVEPRSITWVETSKNVSPAIVKQKLSGVTSGKDVVACWTGRTGHAESNQVSQMCQSRGVEPLLAEHLEEILLALRRLFRDHRVH